MLSVSVLAAVATLFKKRPHPGNPVANIFFVVVGETQAQAVVQLSFCRKYRAVLKASLKFARFVPEHSGVYRWVKLYPKEITADRAASATVRVNGPVCLSESTGVAG